MAAGGLPRFRISELAETPNKACPYFEPDRGVVVPFGGVSSYSIGVDVIKVCVCNLFIFCIMPKLQAKCGWHIRAEGTQYWPE